MIKQISTLTISVVLLSACLLDPVKPTEFTYYQIEPAKLDMKTDKPKNSNFNKTLLVAPMLAVSPYDSTQMYYSSKQYEQSTYTRSQWVTQPNVMIETVVLSHLSKIGPFTATVNGNVITYASYRLNLILNKLILNVQQDKPIVALNVSSQLTDISTGEVIASNNFNIQQPAEVSPQGFAKATNKAANQLSKAIYLWLKNQDLTPETKKQEADDQQSSL